MITNQKLAVGVDLGATKIAAALVTSAGTVLASRQTPTLPAEGYEHVCDRIAAEVRALMEPISAGILGVGIGSPGLVDGRAGLVRHAVNLGWTEVRLAHEVSRRLGGIPVFVENDANANAVGEGCFGSATGCKDYALLTIGSGLGSGVVSGGQLITGAHSMAADLGHYSVDPDHGRLCACGRRGCAETIASGPGLIATMRSILITGSHASRLHDDQDLTPNRILAGARDGDAAATRAIEMMAHVIGEIAAIAAAVIDPDVIVIGGGLGTAATDLIQSIATKEMQRRLPTGMPVPPIRRATLASPAIGSACLVFTQQEK